METQFQDGRAFPKRFANFGNERAIGGGIGGNGEMRVTLGTESVTLALKPGQTDQGSMPDRCGLFAATAGGQMVKIFPDDLQYSADGPRCIRRNTDQPRASPPMKQILPLLAWLWAFAGTARSAEPPAPASFAYILQADSFAKTKAAAVERFAACARDWIVLDAAFSSDEPWERADLDTIRRAQAKRKVVAYISIGEAEDYRPYWRKEWGTRKNLSATAPTWLGTENPEWKGNYRVKYWAAGWQKLMLAAVDDAMARGFDGVYLDIVDGFERFEQEGKEFIDDRVNPETKQSYRRDMVDWVKKIAVQARAKNSAALVIPQNGSQLLAHADFLATISAIGIEDLFTNGNKLQSKSHTDEVLGHLKKMNAAKQPALLIEYPKAAERQALAKKLAKERGLVLLVTDRQLQTLGQSGK